MNNSKGSSNNRLFTLVAMLILVPAGGVVYATATGDTGFLSLAITSGVISGVAAAAVVWEWWSTRWVRAALAQRRSSERLWPIRVDIGRGIRWQAALLEIGQTDLTIHKPRNAIRIKWNQVVSVASVKRGIIPGNLIAVAAREPTYVRIELLESNGVSRASEDSVADCLQVLASAFEIGKREE